MSLFGPKCNHEWEQIDKEVFKSPFEAILDMGGSTEQVGPWMFKKKVVWLLKCKHCTEYKTLTETFSAW